MASSRIDLGRSRPVITSSYDFAWTFQLVNRGAISSLAGATIQAAVVSMDHSTILVAPLAQSSSVPGADWTTGSVTVQIPATSTTALDGMDGTAFLEISVLLAGKRTAYCQLVNIQSGRIAS